MQEDKKDLLQENLNKSFKSKAYNYSTTNNGYYYYSESNNCDYRSFEYDDCDYTTNDFLEESKITRSSSGEVSYLIKPTDYGFYDGYPTSDYIKNNFVTHKLPNNLVFRTRRYRTGYIHDESIVMSSIRGSDKKAFIEYSFNAPVTKIDFYMSYWRMPGHEWLQYTNGKAVLQCKNGEGWTDVKNFLSSEAQLSTDRKSPTQYTYIFENPVYVFRFYCEYNGQAYNNDSNRGRICLGDMTVYTQKDNYFPLNGSELEYEPSLWNNKEKYKYNCYAYSLNTKNHGFMQPGGIGYLTLKDLNKEKIEQGVLQDAAKYNFNFETIGKYEVCKPGYYKVALVVAPNRDYHWYRQNYDGTWSHKPGGDLVINFDGNNEVILNPETCNRRIHNIYYSTFVGFYQVNINGMI